MKIVKQVKLTMSIEELKKIEIALRMSGKRLSINKYIVELAVKAAEEEIERQGRIHAIIANQGLDFEVVE